MSNIIYRSANYETVRESLSDMPEEETAAGDIPFWTGMLSAFHSNEESIKWAVEDTFLGHGIPDATEPYDVARFWSHP
jgi:hypothetical protein